MISLIARDLRWLSHLKGPPLLGGRIAVEVLGIRCVVSGTLPGLLGSQLLDESQTRWSSAGSGTEARHVQSLIKIDEHCPSYSFPRQQLQTPSARRD